MLRKECKKYKEGKVMKENKQEEVNQKRNAKRIYDIPT
jgi:ABC-type enterochelin transport system ATPase subunit